MSSVPLWFNAAGISFPGFMMLSGSRVCLIARITSSAAPCSRSRNFSFPRPTPCSPVHVPPIEIARSASLVDSRSASRMSAGVIRVHRKDDVKIAVADVADERPDEVRPTDVLLGFDDAVRKAGDGDAGVCRPAPRAGTQRQSGVIRIVARLPELRASLGRQRPLE